MLISLISHLIYSLTGTRSEVVYRLIPALGAGGTVGLTTTALATRFGLLAGACAGLYTATVPMFVEYSRELRGYSVATLCAVAATVLLFRSPLTTKRMLALYGALLGLAIAAHVYVGLVLVAHIVWVVMRRSRPSPPRGEVGGDAVRSPSEFVRLFPAWVLAGIIAIAANGYILWVDVTQHGFLPRVYDPAFPRDLIFYLAGAPSLLGLALWLGVAGLGLWAVRKERLVWSSVALVVVVAFVLWQVIQPFYLYPRFFIFLIPGCAYLMAAAVKRWKVLAPVIVLGAMAAALYEVPNYTTDPLALREAAQVVANADSGGQRVCLIHSDEQVLGAYAASGFTVVTEPAQLQACDVIVVVSWGVDIPLRDEAAREFPRARQIPAVYPTVVLER